MLTKLVSRVFKGKPLPEVKVLSVTAPRTEERSLSGAENFLRSIGVPEPFSLEIVGDSAGVTLLARCREGSFVRQQLGAHHRHAQVSELSPEDDPLRLAECERAWSTTLRLQGPEYLPLRTFDDDDLREPGSDPLISVIGALSGLEPGERLAACLSLTSLGPDWSRPHQEKLYRKQQAERDVSPQNSQAEATRTDVGHLAVLGVLALPLLQGYLWVQRGETWKAILLGVGVAAAMTVAGWAWWRIKRARSGNRLHDPLLIKDKLSRLAYQAQLELIAILPEHGSATRAKDLLRHAALAYQGYDNTAGARFKAGKVRPAIPATEPSAPVAGLFRARNVLGVRELAALWHPLGAGNQLASVHRSGSRVLYPAESASTDTGGAHVGNTVGGRPRPVRFNSQVMGRHQFYLARTRMGKSTLMRHIVAHKMAEKAAGHDFDAVVVIDPHADLVDDLLKQVPLEIVDQVYHVNLADETRAPGINLLDVGVFPDRDRAADSVVRGAKGVWEQWGPRMQSILEHVVKTLHEYNSHPDTGADEQLTILDGSRLVSDRKFRRTVLRRVRDPFIIEWWAHTYSAWTRNLQADSIAPVQTRLAYYASSKRARAILGQRRSTLDLGKIISQGGVLLASTAQSDAGREVSSLVGASILNVVDSAIRAQGALPPELRRGVLVVVDEMQALPGVDYEGMLSELGKFGASFILATQSLRKLDDISATLRDTLLANVGSLVVFQISATEARDIMGELDRERVGEEDLASLPSHHCYVRASVEGQREPTYYMELRPPEPGDPEIAQRVRDAASAYTTPAEALARLEAEADLRVRDYRDRLEREDEDDDGQPSGAKPSQPAGGGPGGNANQEQGKNKAKRPRTRRRGEQGAAPEPEAETA